MRNVFEDYAAAKAAEMAASGKRVYRVTMGDRRLYVVAVSPMQAAGIAAQTLDNFKVELVEPRYYVGKGMTIDDVIRSMGFEQKRELLRRLKERG